MFREIVGRADIFLMARAQTEKKQVIWKHLPDPLAQAFLPPLVPKKKELKNGSYLESRIEYIQEWVVFVCLNFLELPPNGLSPGRRQDTDFFPGHGLWALSLCGHVETFHIGQTFLSLQGPSRSVLHNKCIANRNSIVLTYFYYLHTYILPQQAFFVPKKWNKYYQKILSVDFWAASPKKYNYIQNFKTVEHTHIPKNSFLTQILQLTFEITFDQIWYWFLCTLALFRFKILSIRN